MPEVTGREAVAGSTLPSDVERVAEEKMRMRLSSATRRVRRPWLLEIVRRATSASPLLPGGAGKWLAIDLIRNALRLEKESTGNWEGTDVPPNWDAD